MKRNFEIISITLFSIFGFSSCRAAESELTLPFPTSVSVIVVDSNEKPVEGANVYISFLHFLESKHRSFSGKTDESGQFFGKEKISSMVWLSIEKNSFYRIYHRPAILPADVSEEFPDAKLQYVLREKLNPEALYARIVDRAIPQGQNSIGFDLEVGDWVKPVGKGTVADFLIGFQRKFVGTKYGKTHQELLESTKLRYLGNRAAEESYFDSFRTFYEVDRYFSYDEGVRHSTGKWNGMLNLNFPNKKEGVALVDDNYHSFSKLKMPHHAYTRGHEYLAQMTWTENTYSPRNMRDNVGYFLRTRVQLDDKDNVISANYAKITSDIEFDPRGRIRFSYVFNPTPNDPNLEFDPDRNLFKRLKNEEKVAAP